MLSNKEKQHIKRDPFIVTKAAVEIAEKLNVSAIISFSEEISKIPTSIPIIIFTPRKSTIINQLTHDLENEDNLCNKIEERAKHAIQDVSDASVIAFVNNLIDSEGLVVGIISTKDNDSIIVHDLSSDNIMKRLIECTDRVDSKVIKTVLNIALSIANHGREGIFHGTAFIIGDSEEVMRRSHQLILNPFEHQSKENRNIINPETWETVKSFAQLDGVFLITSKGIICTAGRYLDINAKNIPVEKGLGGRHTSAAAITRDTETIAVTVSKSGGIIRVFKDGLMIIKIEPDTMQVR